MVIAVPTATILGGPELYVGAGSTINLTCAIHFSYEPPAFIFWYYNDKVMSYDSPRGGVSVITEKGGEVTTSWLLIQAAQPSDSGEYKCKPSNANVSTIRVHVLTGEYAYLRIIIYPLRHPKSTSFVSRSLGNPRSSPSHLHAYPYFVSYSWLLCLLCAAEFIYGVPYLAADR